MEMPEIRQRKPDPESTNVQTSPATDPAPEPRPNPIPPPQRDLNGQKPQTSWIKKIWVVIFILILGVLVGRWQSPLFVIYSMPGANVTFIKVPDTDTCLGWTLFSPALAHPREPAKADPIIGFGAFLSANRKVSNTTEDEFQAILA